MRLAAGRRPDSHQLHVSAIELSVVTDVRSPMAPFGASDDWPPCGGPDSTDDAVPMADTLTG
jgi:hypothetical protein